ATASASAIPRPPSKSRPPRPEVYEYNLYEHAFAERITIATERVFVSRQGSTHQLMLELMPEGDRDADHSDARRRTDRRSAAHHRHDRARGAATCRPAGAHRT